MHVHHTPMHVHHTPMHVHHTHHCTQIHTTQEQEEAERREELKRLKNLKRQEIEEKLTAIQEVYIGV